jgi:hypothetical protein
MDFSVLSKNIKTIGISVALFLGAILILIAYNYIAFGEITLKSNKYNPAFPEEKSFLTSLSGDFIPGLDFLFTNISNSKNDRLKRDNFFNTLNDCRICGYKAINQDGKCLVCKMYGNKEVLHERYEKKYANIEEWYKDGQLEYYLDYKHNKYKYPRRENEFEKLPNHKLLFTKEELKEFTKKNLTQRKKYNF